MADGLVINDTSYAGEVASNFITKAITGNEIVQGGHCYVKDGIKKAYHIPRLSVDNIIQDRKATPESQGSITVDGKALNPNDYMIYVEFNPRDFEDHWYAAQMNKNLIDARLPVTAESVIIQEVLKAHDKFLGKALLQSDLANGTKPFAYFDGFVTRAKAANSGTIIVPSPAALTTSNIGTAFQSTLNLVPSGILYDVRLKFFVSYKTAQIWEEAQRTGAFKGVDNTQAGLMRFAGRQVVPLAGMPDNTIFAALGSADMSSNLWVGMNSKDDASVKLSQLQANSELWFIKMLCKVDAQIGYNEETVLYSVV
jgi:hypothetical protein